ncbi:hypothetical protein [Streptomyces sp. SID161]|uniref:hypothetical protein n=1 Tax=Streptomyces sp. SID161 TaxID=2690251 RepID=UPI00136D7D49|nr:hypothetical protein [Streptomyces sp. SID161]MYW45998.1 hypothetical protein [Streptomyces sp. SID161]
MSLPKPLTRTLIVVLTYVASVLFLRYRHDGMDWTHALLIGLVVTPLALLVSAGRERLNAKAQAAGERMRARRRYQRSR